MFRFVVGGGGGGGGYEFRKVILNVGLFEGWGFKKYFQTAQLIRMLDHI